MKNESVKEMHEMISIRNEDSSSYRRTGCGIQSSSENKCETKCRKC